MQFVLPLAVAYILLADGLNSSWLCQICCVGSLHAGTVGRYFIIIMCDNCGQYYVSYWSVLC